MGQYTNIIGIVAPGSAVAGSTVSVEVKIKNLCDYIVYVIPVLIVNGGVGEGSYETIVPGQIVTWYFNFTMPNYGVTVIANSWCESDYFEWHLDDTAEKAIALAAELESQFNDIEIIRYERR